MAIGYWLVHAPLGFYPAVNGGDAAILFSFIFLHIAAAGPGVFSIDGLLSGRVDARAGLAAPIVSNAA
jgi:putative oxidoreductase